MITGIVILIILALIISQPFSVVSSSQIQVGEDGNPYWIIQTDGREIGGKYVFNVNSNELEDYDTKDGRIMSPQNDIEIELKDINTNCAYTIGNQENRFREIFPNLFGSNEYVYSINPDTETNVFVTLYDKSSNTEKTLDALNWINTQNRETFEFNGGEIEVSSGGGFVGNYVCPQLSEYFIKINRDDKSFDWYKDVRDRWTETNNEVIDKFEFDCSLSNVPDVPEATGGKVNCKITNGKIATVNPILQLKADAKYLDFKYYASSIGEPKILEVNSPEELKAGETSSVSVKVKNIGEEDGNFILYIDSPSLTVGTLGRTERIRAGEEYVFYETITSSTGQTKDYLSTGVINFCSLGNFYSRGECVEQDFELTAKEKPAGGLFPEPNVCGNNVCDENENSLTCKEDCGEYLICDGLHMSKVSNKCVCNDGYNMIQDDYGNPYCSEIENENMIVIFGVLSFILVILVVMIIIAKRRK